MKTFPLKPHHHLHSSCIGQRLISELGKQALGDTAHPIPHVWDLGEVEEGNKLFLHSNQISIYVKEILANVNN